MGGGGGGIVADIREKKKRESCPSNDTNVEEEEEASERPRGVTEGLFLCLFFLLLFLGRGFLLKDVTRCDIHVALVKREIRDCTDVVIATEKPS